MNGSSLARETRWVAAVLAVALLGGCEGIRRSKEAGPSRQELQTRIEQLQAQHDQQEQRADELEMELTRLRGFDAERLEQLVHVGQIQFGRYTRATEEGVTVYVVLYDANHDKIKAGGVMTIELWALGAQPDGQLRGRWRYEPAELEEYWLGGFLTYHYKFELLWQQGKRPNGEAVTIRVRFEELLTGKAFEIQKLVEAPTHGD